MPALPHLAVVDDEADVAALISRYLGAQGFRVSELHDGAALDALLTADPPALVLLDLGLPGEDGLVLARRLREHTRAGLIIVSGRGDAVDRIVGLEIGADDYITKPFDLRELLARVKAVLRRLEEREPMVSAPTAATQPLVPFHFEGWVLDPGPRRLINPDGDEVTITGGEFDLLKAFVENPGRVLSRDFLLDITRGREAGPFDRTIDVQVGRLRRKIETDAENPRMIKSVRGAGYLFVPPVKRA